MNRLEGKTAVITGSNRGLGKEIMTLFAKEGANIIACSRTEAEEHKVYVDNLSNEYGVEITSVYFDLSDENAIKAGLKEIKALKKPIDILVNNAGVPHLGLVAMTRMSDMRDVFQINYFAQVQIVQGLFTALSKTRGSIVNIASAAGIDGEVGNAVYGATKASMILLTKVLSKEMASAGVRVNAVAPGLTATDFAEAMGDKAKESMVNGSLLHRLGEPSEIAKAVLFLASEEASFITGQVLRVDGGMK